MTKNKRIFVTGATGFIGSWLTRRLHEAGHQVGVMNRADSSPWRIQDLIALLEVYEGDLADTQAVEKAISDFKPDVIFHLATYYTVEHKPAEIPNLINTNVLGTVNLLEAAKNAQTNLFVNTSSCFVYKQKDTPLNEGDELSPLNLYATTKLQAEEACAYYAQTYGLPAATLRLFPPYGPADNERKLIPFMIKSFLERKSPDLTSGKQQWDFVYVQDIVDAYIRLMDSQIKSKHEIFNIGTGNANSIKEVAENIRKIVNSDVEPNWGKVPHRKNEVWFTSANINKANTMLDWKPKTSLNQGLTATVEWYKKDWTRGKP
jgi:nucleoside-diphosphate-sugar epimerase